MTQIDAPGQTIPRPAVPTSGTVRAPASSPVTSPPPWTQPHALNLNPKAGRAGVRGTTNLVDRAAPLVPTSAQQTITNFLAPYGLESLGTWAWNLYRQLGGGQTALDTIQFELPNQPAYQQRFPAIAARQKAGLPTLTPAQYLQYEATVDASLAQVGAPSQIRAGTPAFAKLTTDMLTGDVSASEASARIVNGYATVRDADPSVRQWFGDKFGAQGDAALLTTFLAPEHSLTALQEMEQQAQVGGSAARSGIDLGLSTAQRIAAINPTGSTDTQFEHLAQLDPLFHARPGDQTPVSLDQGIAGAFGLDATSAAAVQRELDERAASVAGGTSVTTDQTGITGVGAAR